MKNVIIITKLCNLKYKYDKVDFDSLNVRLNRDTYLVMSK